MTRGFLTQGPLSFCDQGLAALQEVRTRILLLIEQVVARAGVSISGDKHK